MKSSATPISSSSPAALGRVRSNHGVDLLDQFAKMGAMEAQNEVLRLKLKLLMKDMEHLRAQLPTQNDVVDTQSDIASSAQVSFADARSHTGYPTMTPQKTRAGLSAMDISVMDSSAMFFTPATKGEFEPEGDGELLDPVEAIDITTMTQDEVKHTFLEREKRLKDRINIQRRVLRDVMSTHDRCSTNLRKTCEESNPNINVILEQAHALEERGQIISRLIGEPFRKAVPSKGTKQDGDDSNAEDTSRIHDLNSSRHSILLDDQQDDSLLFDLVDESIIKSDGLQSNAATPWKTKSNVLVDVAMQTEAVEGDIFTLQQCKVELEKSKEQDEDYILSMNYIQYQLGEVLFAINHTQDSPGSRGLLGSAAKQYQMSISLQQFDPSQHISMTKQESLLSLDGVGYAGHASNTPTSQKKRQASTVNNSKNNDFVNKYLFDDSTPSTPSSSFYQKDQHVLASGEKSLSINIDKSFAEPVIDYEHIYEELGDGVEDAELRIRPAVEDGDENDEQLMQNMSCRTVHLHEIYPDADDGKESEEEEDDKVQLEIDLIRKQQSDEEYDKRDPLTKMKSFAPTAAINPLLRAKSSRSAKSTSSTSSPADQPAGSRTSSAVTTPADNPRKQALPPLTPSQLEVSYHGKLRHDVEQLTKEIDEEIERILWSQQHTSAKKTATTPKRVRLADRTHDISHDFSELDLHKNTVTWDTSLQRDVQDMETWMDYEIEQITVGFQDVVRKHYYHPDHSTTSATDLSASAYLASPASRTHRVVDGDEEKKDSQYLHMHSTRGRDNVMNEGYNDLVEEAKDLQIRELQLQISSLQLQQTKSEQQHQTLQKQHQRVSRELQLYKDKIFTIVETAAQEGVAGGGSAAILLQSLPTINISWQQQNSFASTESGSLDLTYLSTSTAQLFFILQQLIDHHNEMLQQVQGVQDAKQVVEDKLQLLESRYVDVVQELQKKETQQQRWKSVIKHSNQSMHMMEADYVVLQKQVELLTKKLQMSTTADSFQMTSSSSFHNSSMNQSTSSIQRPPPTPPRTDIMDVSKMRFTSPSFKLHH